MQPFPHDVQLTRPRLVRYQQLLPSLHERSVQLHVWTWGLHCAPGLTTPELDPPDDEEEDEDEDVEALPDPSIFTSMSTSAPMSAVIVPALI